MAFCAVVVFYCLNWFLNYSVYGWKTFYPPSRLRAHFGLQFCCNLSASLFIRGQIPYILYYNVLPSEAGVTGASASLVGDEVEGGGAGLTAASTSAVGAGGSRVSAISLQSSKALQELVARRTVLAVMSHVIQVRNLLLFNQ